MKGEGVVEGGWGENGSAKRNQIPSRLRPVGRLVHSPTSLPRRVVKDCTPPGAHAPTSPPNALHAMILFTPDTPDDDLYLSLYVSSYRAVVRAVVRVVALAIALVVVVGHSPFVFAFFVFHISSPSVAFLLLASCSRSLYIYQDTRY